MFKGMFCDLAFHIFYVPTKSDFFLGKAGDCVVE